jgi:DNA-binding NarL/FixJ family response regulator
MKMLVNSMYDESVYAERSLQAGALGYLSKQTARETLITPSAPCSRERPTSARK